DGPVSFSPDGKQMVFVRGSSAGKRALIIAKADGSDERELASRTGYDAFTFTGPGWSPDGKTIASGAAYSDVNGPYLSVVTVNSSDGSINRITKQRWKKVGRIAWLDDGSGMVFNAIDLQTGSTSQLWHLSYPNGEAQKITTDVQDYDQVTITSDGTTLITKQTQINASLWVAPNNDANQAKEILSHNEDDSSYYYYRTRFSWMPDGRLIYTALVNGIPNIWVTTAQGDSNKQLTNNPTGNSFPSTTPDGRFVVFVSERTGFANVWRLDNATSTARQLTSGEADSWA